jgi:hypothetical protein
MRRWGVGVAVVAVVASTVGLTVAAAFLVMIQGQGPAQKQADPRGNGTARLTPLPEAELLDVRLEDAAGQDGKSRKVVCVDWRSAGQVPVRKVTATLTALGPDGKFWEQAEVVVYDGPPVPPGQEYRQPAVRGFVLPDLPGLDDVVVEVTGVD